MTLLFGIMKVLKNLMTNEQDEKDFNPILDWIPFAWEVRLSEFSNILTHYIDYKGNSTDANSIQVKDFSNGSKQD